MTSIYDVRKIVDGEILNAVDLVVQTEIEVQADGVVHHHKFSPQLEAFVRQIVREEIEKAIKKLTDTGVIGN